MDEMAESSSDGIELSDGIEKNLLKAGWMLTAGLVNIPLQKIERHLAEKKADSDARIMVTQTLSQRISEQLNVPEEYVTLAVAKSFGNIVQEQMNVDSIYEQAQLHLQNTPQDKHEANREVEEISDDWLNRFRESACQKSSEEAQELFAKVLAGEIRKPDSFSLKALTTLADMDQNVALYFKTFCSLCLVTLDDPKMYHITQSKSHFKIRDARIHFITESMNDIVIIPQNKRDSTSKFAKTSQSIYNSFGLTYRALNLLTEYGLVEASLDTTVYTKFSHCWHNNELWGFLKSVVDYPQSLDDLVDIPISGYKLTSVGKELFHITERHAHPRYWEMLTTYLQELYSIKLYKYPKVQKKASSPQNTPSTEESAESTPQDSPDTDN